MLEVVIKYLTAGLSIIPVKPDKRPVGEWKQYQCKIAGAEAERWTLPIGCVCGCVSGGLTCIDFDNNGSAFAEWGKRLSEVRPDLINRVYMQRTPSGGWHTVFRSELKIENRKLAQKRVDGKIVVLIETRGEGGYFLLAPSEGYVSKHGDICTLEKLSVEDAETLILIAESFNEIIEDERPKIIESKSGLTPFDDYDNKNTPIDLLTTHGWTVISNRSDKVMLCRPGKKNSLSATWNHIPGRFYVFSTSTEFEARHIYKPSAVYSILEHRGDYVAAAKQLYKNNYGDRVAIKKDIDVDTVMVTATVQAKDFRQEIYDFYKGKREKGLFLGMQQFDKLLRFDKGQLNVITGISTHGKSEFLDFLVMKLAMKYNWRFVVFSPENYPLSIHFNKLAEKYAGRSMWGAEPHILEESIDFINDKFDFVNATEDELSLETILNACIDVKAKRGVDALIIDPWNEIEQASRPRDMSDSDFTGVCLRRLRKFARKNGICLFVVAHPTKMYRQKDSDKYPVPTLYDISGSANWYNKTDNGIIVYRDFDFNLVQVYVKKVKYRNYGMIGHVNYTFDVDSGSYVEIPESDFEKNNKSNGCKESW